MTLPRTVSTETLDTLAAHDARAVRSRRDLRRVNRILGSRGTIIGGMRSIIERCPRDLPLHVLELGAGDGSLMLRIAQEMSASWPAVHLTLLDRVALVDAATSSAYSRLGWTVQSLNVNVLDWAALPMPSHLPARWDVIVANLFLHHFDNSLLRQLLLAVAARCNCFIACEPRRSRFALIGSYLIGAVGANSVTREDAVLSVHAGFHGAELSMVWPRDHDDWQLQEHAAGLFSHLFCAARRGAAAAGAA